MTLAQALQQSTRTLSRSGIEDSHLEARILLEHILKLSPAQLYTQTERVLSREQVKSLQELIERRLCREPAAYIVGHKEFYGTDFYVDSRVLISRPETETLVAAAFEFAKGCTNHFSSPGRPLLIADVGTGCGAIAISLALNLPQSKVYATDISPSALEVARLNCEHHNVTEQIILVQGNLLEPVPEPVDLIVANLPYIRNSELANLSPEITNFEPRVALDGGESGLEQIRQLLKQAERKIRPGGRLLFEIGQEQEKAVASLINHCLPRAKFEFIPDSSGIDRAVRIDF
ncbi:MAG: peptide chain release factor N(5)-glutamine methyltransferase [Dehalococcoidia bacterium]|nr:peptide chain release factor N(5)-glutamine methyltransferase [Dehalococcoidia bacterium]